MKKNLLKILRISSWLTTLLLAGAVNTLIVPGNEIRSQNIQKLPNAGNSSLTYAAVGPQAKPRVTVKDIGPELGSTFTDSGFIFNLENPRQVILPSGVLGIFRSLNGGQNWSPLELLSPEGFRIGGSLRQDPSNPKVFFAATGYGVYRTEDFGTTWTEFQGFQIPFNYPPIDFAFNPVSPNVILALAVPDLSFGNSSLWKSVDGGATFQPQPNSGLPGVILDPDTGETFTPLFERIITTPADPNIVYVTLLFDDTGHFPPSIYKSVDGGQSFSRLESAPAVPHQIIPHPTDPNVLFVGGFPGLFRSTDGGASFEQIPINGRVFVSFDANNPSHVYVARRTGVFRSTNGGDSFVPLGLTAEQLGFFANIVSVDPTNSRNIYVNTTQGNFKSTNGGVSFKSINKGWRGAFVNHTTFDNASNPSLYLAMQGGAGILKTNSRGNHYEVVPNSAGGHSPTVLAVSPADPNLILTGTQSGGLFWTSDGGQTWYLSAIDTGLREFSPGGSEIAFDSIDPNKAYFVANTWTGENSGFFRSTDAGRTFQRTNFLPDSIYFTDLGIDPTNPNAIFTQNSGFSAPAKSVDGGLSFTEGPIYWCGVKDFVIDPKNSNNVYLAGLFQLDPFNFDNYLVVRSTDGGVTYSRSDVGISVSEVIGMVINPDNPARLYTWTKGGLFMTNNRGTTWTLIEGEETVRDAQFGHTLAINPKKPNLLYLAGATVLEVEIRD